jgi:hypothetical protein
VTRLAPSRSRPIWQTWPSKQLSSLDRCPGVDMKALQPTIKFWKVVRDQSRAAALACVGANHSLAGALVAFRLLRNIGGEGRLKTMQIEQPCTSVESIKQLRQAQVPDAVIVVMLRRGKERA